MVEFAIVLPVILLVALGTVDVTMMLWDWAQADKAAYRGARVAIVTEPVATGITSFNYDTNPLHMGDRCFLPSTGAGNVAVNCPTVETNCTSTACTGGQTVDSNAFNQIVAAMQKIFPRLTAANVEVEYRTNGLGFYGRPGGLPMDVTVRLRCMKTQLFFLPALAGWTFSDLPDDCPASSIEGPNMPTFSSTLTSEAMGDSSSYR
jgi:Flp pilus assembly protein TadG